MLLAGAIAPEVHLQRMGSPTLQCGRLILDDVRICGLFEKHGKRNRLVEVSVRG
jgi:hypothetical protein